MTPVPYVIVLSLVVLGGYALLKRSLGNAVDGALALVGFGIVMAMGLTMALVPFI